MAVAPQVFLSDDQRVQVRVWPDGRAELAQRRDEWHRWETVELLEESAWLQRHISTVATDQPSP